MFEFLCLYINAFKCLCGCANTLKYNLKVLGYAVSLGLSLLPYCCVSGLNSLKIAFFLTQLRKLLTNSNKRLHIKWTDASFLCNLLQITFLSFTLKPPQSPFPSHRSYVSLPLTSSLSSFYPFYLPNFTFHTIISKCAICLNVCKYVEPATRHGVRASPQHACSHGSYDPHVIKLTSSFAVQSTRLLHFYLFVSLHTCAHTWMCM